MATPHLFALTPEGVAAFGGAELELKELPFRVGRESRKYDTPEKKALFADKRSPKNKPNNDLYLVEETDLINVSREHFQIVREAAGYALEDRGSTLGTIVEGKKVGGENAGGKTSLRDGDVIIVGASVSPFVFKFRLR